MFDYINFQVVTIALNTILFDVKFLDLFVKCGK